MCGIAGLFMSDGSVDQYTLLAMTEAVRHRGPDDGGIQMFSQGGIGNRRLSIIDLESGKQPLCNEDGTVWITFNGEIYNFQELANELKKAGHRFKTRSDTEVIVHAYEQWGTSAFRNFRGMFAFAIVDLRKNIVVCARDHFGIKPFFYTKTDNLFAFASEIQQFKQIRNLDFTIDLSGIDQYLWLKYIPAPRTIFRGIQKLPPAHCLIYSLDGRLQCPHEYWQLSYKDKKSKKEGEWLEELDQRLRESVKAHLVSDVDVGVFLSGGIDSSLLTYHATELKKDRVKTFSIGFAEQQFDETRYAQICSAKFRTEHYSRILGSDSLEALPKLVKHYGEPYGDSSCIAAYFVSKLAREHVKVALSGEGGDECFAGYLKYGKWKRLKEKATASDWKSRLRIFAERYLAIDHTASYTLQSWLDLRETITKEIREKLWGSNFGVAHETIPGARDISDRLAPFSNVNRLQYVDLKTYLAHQLLPKMDIAGMIHGLEVRTPFTDKDIWEFAATIPETLLYDLDGRTYEGKLLLKKLATRHFDESFAYRRKHGFVMPIEVWFSSDDHKHRLEETLLSPSSKIQSLFDRNSMSDLLRTGNGQQIWQLLFLEEWLKSISEPRVV